MDNLCWYERTIDFRYLPLILQDLQEVQSNFFQQLYDYSNANHQKFIIIDGLFVDFDGFVERGKLLLWQSFITSSTGADSQSWSLYCEQALKSYGLMQTANIV